MTRKYRPRHAIRLEPGATYRRPPPEPDWIRLDDAALNVLTDFLKVPPRTVSPNVAIDDALEQMKAEGVRLLLVVEGDDEVVGSITARDIDGEKPIQLIQERRVARTDLVVRDIMTPRDAIRVLNMISVRDASVGHILATHEALELQHLLVVEDDEDTARQFVRGLFSTSQIHKQMHRPPGEKIPPAHSLSEIIRSMG